MCRVSIPIAAALPVFAVAASAQARDGRLPFALDKPIGERAASAPFGAPGRQFPLVRVGSAQFHLRQDGDLQAVLQGSITTAAKRVFAVSVLVYDGAGRRLGGATALERVQHIDLGRVLTEIRTWRMDLGAAEWSRAVAFSVSVRTYDDLGIRAATPAEAVAAPLGDEVTVRMRVADAGIPDGLLPAGADPIGSVLLDYADRVNGAPFYVCLTSRALRGRLGPQEGSARGAGPLAGTPGELCQRLRGRTIRATGHITETRYPGAAHASDYYLIVDSADGLQVMP